MWSQQVQRSQYYIATDANGTPEIVLNRFGEVVREVMEGAAGPALELTVPLTVDAGIADNWAEAH